MTTTKSSEGSVSINIKQPIDLNSIQSSIFQFPHYQARISQEVCFLGRIAD